jgi:hypothetical protein
MTIDVAPDRILDPATRLQPFELPVGLAVLIALRADFLFVLPPVRNR